MTREEEDQLLRRAVERGWLHPDDTARLDEEAARDTVDAAGRHGARVERLVRRGLLDERSLAELFAEVGRAAEASPRTLGRYRIVGQLGAGGAGVVYRAHDPQLGRDVAIKVLPAASEGSLAEARAQARVDHEHVCKVFEVGELEGRPTIVMQLVEGETLRVAARGMTVEQKVAVLAQVADAVHAAHRIGLIHRDLKPTNIMVERGGKPYVMDFGLARDVDASLSASGGVVGTPPYMAPEQARGETRALDRRTDVYSLGATLYEVLTGKAPFAGDTGAAVLVRVLSDDPVSLRRLAPAVPADLETVALKCLEKEPARRYDSARALADDLRRFLDGEPVAARRAGVTYRLGKRLRKHRVAAASLAVAVLAIAGAGAVALRAGLRSAAEAEAARRFGEEVQSIETVMRLAALSPLHDTRREREIVRARMAAIEARMAGWGDDGRAAAGSYALGRGHLALGEPAAARARLERAWELGARGPEVALALAQALGALYAAEVERARLVVDDDERAARLAELGTRLREPARRALERSRGATLLESTTYTEALIDHIEGRHAEAARRARVAADELPWLFEARRLEGDALRAQAGERFDGGDYDGALALLADAGERYAQALTIARSDAATLRAEFERRRLSLEIRTDKKGGAAPADFDPAVEAFDAAKLADPAARGLDVQRAHLEVQRASFLRQTGKGDPMPAVARALVYATLELDDPETWYVLGLAYWVRGNVLGERGQDPRPSLREAARAARRAVAFAPRFPRGHNTAGVALRAIADHEMRLGLDPRPVLQEAVAHYQAALALDPKFIGVWNNLGRALAVKAEYELRHGLDPAATVAEVVASFRRGAELDGQNHMMVNNLGNALHQAAQAARAAGRDPRPFLVEADAAYARAAALNPKHPFAVSNLGGDALLLAEQEHAEGLDPRPSLARARERFDAALALNPTFASAFLGLARAWSLEAEVEVAAGGAATSALAHAAAALARARKLRPAEEKLPIITARLALARAAREERFRRSPAASFDEATAALEAALASHPAVADLHAWDAEVRRRRAEWLGRTGKPASEEAARAEAAAARALAIHPRHEIALAARSAIAGLHR